MGWEEGELQENFEKNALFYEGTEKWQKNMNIALLSQRLLSMIAGCFSTSFVSLKINLGLKKFNLKSNLTGNIYKYSLLYKIMT